jgi:hypothetical protein
MFSLEMMATGEDLESIPKAEIINSVHRDTIEICRELYINLDFNSNKIIIHFRDINLYL